jgi:hypothetical protein
VDDAKLINRLRSPGATTALLVVILGLTTMALAAPAKTVRLEVNGMNYYYEVHGIGPRAKEQLHGLLDGRRFRRPHGGPAAKLRRRTDFNRAANLIHYGFCALRVEWWRRL